jgi:hypothetical protein
MMLVNRDPKGKPLITEAMVLRAKEMGLQLAAIYCADTEVEIEDEMGISFIALVPFLPRAGDRIALENGRVCEVQKAFFKIVQMRDTSGVADAILLVPNVLAILLSERGKQ